MKLVSICPIALRTALAFTLILPAPLWAGTSSLHDHAFSEINDRVCTGEIRTRAERDVAIESCSTEKLQVNYLQAKSMREDYERTLAQIARVEGEIQQLNSSGEMTVQLTLGGAAGLGLLMYFFRSAWQIDSQINANLAKGFVHSQAGDLRLGVKYMNEARKAHQLALRYQGATWATAVITVAAALAWSEYKGEKVNEDLPTLTAKRSELSSLKETLRQLSSDMGARETVVASLIGAQQRQRR
jgi:hypothetical protein